MNEAKRVQMLIEKLKPFCPPEKRSDAYTVVKEWIEQALRRVLDGRGELSFAPLNEYFQTTRDIRQSFAKMVEIEFEGVKLDHVDAQRALTIALRDALDRTMQREGRPMLDQRRIAPRVFDLLQFLFDLDANEAYRWAARALRDHDGFASLCSANGTPAPIALYFASPATRFGGGEYADVFEQAMFDWCVANAHESGTVSICLSLLPRVLASLSVGSPVEAVSRQTDVFVRISTSVTKDGETLARALDALAWRNARVAGGDPLESTVGIETTNNFMRAANEIANCFAPGLRGRLEELKLSEINDLISLSDPTRGTPQESVEEPKSSGEFGMGDMMEGLLRKLISGPGGEGALDAY